jgi:hypothetical protein
MTAPGVNALAYLEASALMGQHSATIVLVAAPPMSYSRMG